MQRTLIYGNGAMARVVYSYARTAMDIVGFSVDGPCIAEHATRFCDLPLVPLERVAGQWNPAEHSVLVAVGYREMNALRERKCEELQAQGYALASYIHPGAAQHYDVTIGAGTIILDHVSIHPGCRIGSQVFISSNVNIGHDCHIGDGCWINSGVAVAGGCHIGKGSFFGVNASVAHGVRVGSRNFIAANTFIARHTDADQVYLSEPGQRLKMNSQDFLEMSSRPLREAVGQ